MVRLDEKQYVLAIIKRTEQFWRPNTSLKFCPFHISFNGYFVPENGSCKQAEGKAFLCDGEYSNVSLALHYTSLLTSFRATFRKQALPLIGNLEHPASKFENWLRSRRRAIIFILILSWGVKADSGWRNESICHFWKKRTRAVQWLLTQLGGSEWETYSMYKISWCST